MRTSRESHTRCNKKPVSISDTRLAATRWFLCNIGLTWPKFQQTHRRLETENIFCSSCKVEAQKAIGPDLKEKVNR